MIQLTVMQKGSAQYLVYDLQGANREIDGISVMMINSDNQKKNGSIAKISFDELNGEKQRILFEITGMVRLSDYLRRNQIPESCCNLILAIVSAIDDFSEYMIDADSVLLNPDYVFVNPITKQVTFICPPFVDKSDLQTSDLSTFFRTICTLVFSNPVLRPADTNVLQMVSNASANPAAFSLDTIRKILTPEQAKTPAAQSAVPEAAAQNPVTSSAGDVAFEPNVAFAAQEAPRKLTKQTKNAKSVKPVKAAKTADDANITPVPMPGTEKKEKKSIFDKFKKKKSEPKDAKDSGGGIAALAKGKQQQQQPAAMPASAPVQTPPPVPTQTAVPVPNSAAIAPNHTILIPAGSAVQPLSAEGLAAMSARMDQAQQNLFSAPESSAIPQTPNANDVLSGGMSGLQSVGLAAPEAPAAVQTPEAAPVQTAQAALSDDPKTIAMFPDDDKTVFLQKASLTRKRDGIVFKIEQPLVRIGRNRPDIEINLRGNNHIGHLHASILMANGAYAVIDHQSVNHTYLNHQQLEPEKQYPLKHGDIIVCADEEFEFNSEN